MPSYDNLWSFEDFKMKFVTKCILEKLNNVDINRINRFSKLGFCIFLKAIPKNNQFAVYIYEFVKLQIVKQDKLLSL